MSVFRGQYYHSLDDKGRIIFPAKFREVFAEKYDNRLVITKLNGCLKVFPYEEWLIIEEKFMHQSLFNKDVVDFARYFISAAVDLTLDSQGRILIPPNLREYAGIEKEVVSAGMMRVIEIWSRKNFDETINQIEPKVEFLGKQMTDLGI